MAYFIVIGTDNDVKGVVDEIKTAHLQHNIVTSGCVLSQGEDLYYSWDIFNESGNRINDDSESISLHNALTNQISQFKTLIPDDVIPNALIVAKCFDEADCKVLQMVCEELYQIGGAMMRGLQVDIVLVGYDLSKPQDVTIRPHWRILESLQGVENSKSFHTNILYVNNMDYIGAATNVDSRILGRFLCHWSKMVCSGGYDPKSTVRSKVYSIGMSEHQYDFRDLNGFFKLAAEERLLDRTLNDNPSPDTAALLESGYYKKIDLNLAWIDGLCHIQEKWNSYCSTEWDSSKSLSDNVYSVARQERELGVYLNQFLKLYIAEESREISSLEMEIKQKESELVRLSASLAELDALSDLVQYNAVQESIDRLDQEINACRARLEIHRENIANNTFLDAEEFFGNYGTMERITDDDEEVYAFNFENAESLIEYVKSEEGIRIMREAIERATIEDVLPQPYPAATVANVGCCAQREISDVEMLSMPATTREMQDDPSEKSGCLAWFMEFFKKKSRLPELRAIEAQQLSPEVREYLTKALNKCVAALKRVDDIRLWWSTLCEMVVTYKKRQAECLLLMDGEKNLNGEYLAGKKGYCVPWHRKSISLIDMDRVRQYRDNDPYYKRMVAKFLTRWFDKQIAPEDRMTMPELIKHQVLDPLVGRFHTLKWDGTNPFVEENISDDVMHEYIEHDSRQSKPFVEYVLIQESNLESNLNVGFFSNNPNIPTESIEFNNRYRIGPKSINPIFLKDFVNSLCVIQVLDIPNHIDALKDFKPLREYELEHLRTNIVAETANIIGNATTIEAKARAIYDWLCSNIAYDTTKQIRDAETCWNVRKGVCQAYSELFCHMAEAVGLTADIIVGKTKDSDGVISDEKHAWIFVYTQGYDGLLIDPTWGAGGVSQGRFVRSEDNSKWFNVSPYWMIFSHLPDQQMWSKLDISITEEQFRRLPHMLPSNESDGKDFLFEALSKLQDED